MIQKIEQQIKFNNDLWNVELTDLAVFVPKTQLSVKTTIDEITEIIRNLKDFSNAFGLSQDLKTDLDFKIQGLEKQVKSLSGFMDQLNKFYTLGGVQN